MSERHEQPEQPEAGLSWDTERVAAPQRPTIVSSLKEEPLLERPRPVAVALAVVVLAVLAFIAAVIIAWQDLDTIRATLLSVIPDDLAQEYAEDDTELAVNVLLGAFGAVGGALSLLQLLAARTLFAHQTASARALFIVITVLDVPVTVLMSALAGVTPTVNALLFAGLGALIVAAALMCLPRVSAWLRQRDQRRSIPLTQFQQGSTLGTP